MISVRLDQETEQHLDRVAIMQGISRSELVRLAIDKYLAKYNRPSPWELGKDLFGKHGSNPKEGPEELGQKGRNR